MTPQIKQRIEQIKKNEIPEGYKSTQVGVVPCEWEESNLGELFDFFGGLGIPRDQLSDKGIPYLHYGDMHRNTFTKVSHEQYSLRPLYDISLKGDEKYLLYDGDVVFLDASEDLEGTSRSVLIDNVENKPFISGLHTFIARSKNDKLDKEYKQFITSSQAVQKQFEKKSVGFKVYGVNRNSIKGINLAFPKDIAEQNRIAEILSTQDRVIEQQEKLISQKEEQKKYLMQVLLTGKKRLEGFYGEWEEKSIRDLCTMFSGGTPLTSKKEYYNGEIPFIRSGEIDCIQTELFVSEIGVKNSSAKFVKEGDLLISLYGANSGENAISKMSGVINQAILCVRTEKINIFFLYCILQLNKEEYVSKFLQGGQGNLSADIIKSIKIKYPKFEKEQEAIAEILSTADKEIELLKKQLEEEKLKKKSLMQLLLTGIVRV